MWITVASFQTFEDLWRHRNIDSKANPKCAKVSFMCTAMAGARPTEIGFLKLCFTEKCCNCFY